MGHYVEYPTVERFPERYVGRNNSLNYHIQNYPLQVKIIPSPNSRNLAKIKPFLPSKGATSRRFNNVRLNADPIKFNFMLHLDDKNIGR